MNSSVPHSILDPNEMSGARGTAGSTNTKNNLGLDENNSEKKIAVTKKQWLLVVSAFFVFMNTW